MVKKIIIKEMMELGALKINTNDLFTWTSGIKSPIYVDNRLVISDPKLRTLIYEQLTELIQQKFTNCNLIGGCATAGIPHATLIANQLDLPLIYFRTAAKEHGTKSLIEGKYDPGQKIVIVEDLVSTAKSISKAITEAKKANLEVIGAISIFSYNFNEATQKFKTLDCPFYALLTIDDLTQNFNQEQKDVVKEFLKTLNKLNN